MALLDKNDTPSVILQRIQHGNRSSKDKREEKKKVISSGKRNTGAALCQRD
jgi:hypothetical protein